MEFSPLVQLLIVAALAYGAGLLLGLSFYRGEIGPGQRRHGVRTRGPVTPPPALTAGDRARRRRRKIRNFQDQMGERVRQVVALAILLTLITIGCLGVYGVMRLGLEVVTSGAV